MLDIKTSWNIFLFLTAKQREGRDGRDLLQVTRRNEGNVDRRGEVGIKFPEQAAKLDPSEGG